MSEPRSITTKDWIGIAGLTLLVAGVGWIYRPLAPIVAGVVLVAYAYATAR